MWQRWDEITETYQKSSKKNLMASKARLSKRTPTRPWQEDWQQIHWLTTKRDWTSEERGYNEKEIQYTELKDGCMKVELMKTPLQKYWHN